MTEQRVLVVDDEEGMLEVCEETLATLPDVRVVAVQDSREAARRVADEQFDLMITDIRMPGVDGVELLRTAREHDPHLPALMLTAYPTVETAVEAMKLGAVDYITKPFRPDDLQTVVRRLLEEGRLREENRLLQRRVERSSVFDEFVGESAPMRKVFEAIQRVAESDTDVLIVGETGTGKELAARSIHAGSRRRAKFVPVDCGAIPESLLESEFFGHERGSFTGATSRSLGLLEFADGGTFFLDEIAELPGQLQAKLLRVLQERRVRRVGGKEEIDVDVRFVAATSRNLDDEIRERRFRNDLYYRINVARIELPPLRKRRDDIPPLIRHFLRRFGPEMGKREVRIQPDALEILTRYAWPGNVRELQNAIKRALTMAAGSELTPDDLPEEVTVRAGKDDPPGTGGFFEQRAERVAAFEREYLTDLLRRFEGDVTAAARGAELPRGTLYRLLKKYGLAPAGFRP